jgi:ATP-dependent Clp protease adapter protein ClpS
MEVDGVVGVGDLWPAVALILEVHHLGVGVGVVGHQAVAAMEVEVRINFAIPKHFAKLRAKF